MFPNNYHHLQYPKSLTTFVQSQDKKWNKPLVIGHRGSLYHALENTRQSFILAAREGCDGVELDVFLLKCGTLVVFHGEDGSYNDKPGGLKSYCNINGSILDYTAEEARYLLKFNPYFDEFGCGSDYILTHGEEVYIPTLREVLLDAKLSGIIVKIELKGLGTALPVVKLVEELDMVDQCQYSSFFHDEIQRVRELRPEKRPDGSFRYATGALFDQVPENFIQIAQSAGASEIHLKYSTCTTERVRAIHEAQMGSMAWMRGPRGMSHDIIHIFDDVGDEDERMYSILIATGVQSLCVNKPDRLVDFLKKNQEYFIPKERTFYPR
jgi:glycerophosphoryl diester phosphodiesterase